MAKIVFCIHLMPNMLTDGKSTVNIVYDRC